MKTGKLLISLLSFSILSSCVSIKQFRNEQQKLRNFTSENEQLRKENIDLSTSNTEMKSKIEILSGKNKEITDQMNDAMYNLEIQKRNSGVLEKEKNDLLKQFDALNAGSSKEIEKLFNQLQIAQTDLKSREEKLVQSEKDLTEKNKKLIELQNILSQKDQAVRELKEKVLNALVGFSNNGLTVHEKNGKVYVSMDEKLLFKTGKWDVDPNGQKALRDLSAVLAQNKEINITVEGHTDDIAMKGTGDVKDNWDLSVMRATAVTKVLTQNKQIDPSRIISAGRSEYLPVSQDKTAEGRQINRRTEIILTPKIDELLKLIESN